MRFRNRSTLAMLLLAAMAGGAGAQTYDLRGPAPAQGTIVQSRTEWKCPKGTFTLEEGGSVVRGRSSFESVSVTEIEAVQTAGRELKMARYTVAEDWWKRSLQQDGSTPQTATQDGPMIGETLLLERRDDGWQQTMLGHEPDEKQNEWLRRPFVEGVEVYPVRPAAVGESWSFEGARLAKVTGFSDALSVDGKATYTLDRVIEEGGDRLAIISYRIELRVKRLDDNQSPVDFTRGGSGQIRRSLKTYLDVLERFTGQEQYAMTLHDNGRTMAHTEAGACESTSSQRLVTAASRAAVVRRGTTAPAASPAVATTVQSPAGTAAASCKGFALPCAQRTEFNCGFGSGCFASGTCSGVPTQTCFGKAQFTCATTPGCFWQSWSKTCGGVPTCFGKASFACKATLGCRWQATCTGNAKPCSALGKAACGNQPGCFFQ